jgi:hypothetical protein
MSFLAPWALVIGALAAVGAVLLHLVARQRPAAYSLPTTRFIPERRTLVSRAATRPRDLLLLALRALLLLMAGAAFARPVLLPRRGAVARIVLLDRSRAVASATDGVARARAIVGDGVPTVLVAFDSVPTLLSTTSWDSLAAAPRSGAVGSLSAALVAARRAGPAIAERADSVQLVLVSPLAASELDSATQIIRDLWPGAVRLERIALRVDSGETWQLDHPVPARDPLGPSVASVRSSRGGRITRLIRTALRPADSAFARDGGTVVRWDSAAAAHPMPEGLAMGDDVIVASLGRTAMSSRGSIAARWADGAAAATEVPLGKGCMREVGVALPAAGDIALHPPFQRIARALLSPCNRATGEHAADSLAVARLAGNVSNAARGDELRTAESRPSPLARWLLAVALLLAFLELLVRTRAVPEIA